MGEIGIWGVVNLDGKYQERTIDFAGDKFLDT